MAHAGMCPLLSLHPKQCRACKAAGTAGAPDAAGQLRRRAPEKRGDAGGEPRGDPSRSARGEPTRCERTPSAPFAACRCCGLHAGAGHGSGQAATGSDVSPRPGSPLPRRRRRASSRQARTLAAGQAGTTAGWPLPRHNGAPPMRVAPPQPTGTPEPQMPGLYPQAALMLVCILIAGQGPR